MRELKAFQELKAVALEVRRGKSRHWRCKRGSTSHAPRRRVCGLSPEGSAPGRTLEDELDGGDKGGGKNSWQAFIVI